MEVRCYVSHFGQRVVVRFGDHIKMIVITTRPPGAIVFPDKMKGGRPKGHKLFDIIPFFPYGGTSALASRNFSGERWRKLVFTGGPDILM